MASAQAPHSLVALINHDCDVWEPVDLVQTSFGVSRLKLESYPHSNDMDVNSDTVNTNDIDLAGSNVCVNMRGFVQSIGTCVQ